MAKAPNHSCSPTPTPSLLPASQGNTPAPETPHHSHIPPFLGGRPFSTPLAPGIPPEDNTQEDFLGAKQPDRQQGTSSWFSVSCLTAIVVTLKHHVPPIDAIPVFSAPWIESPAAPAAPVTVQKDRAVLLCVVMRVHACPSEKTR